MARRNEEDEPEKVPSNKQSIRSLRNSLNKDDSDKVTWDLTKGDAPTIVKEFIPTGCTLLDYTMSNRRNGGVPVGKLTAIAGEEASGKSLMCAHIVAEVQRRGGIAVYIDSENALDVDFMRQIGVDIESLVYIQPGTVEKAFEHMENCVKVLRAKNPNVLMVIIWDSVGGTPTQAEIEGSYDPNSSIGLLGKALSKGLRKLIDLVAKERVALVFTNHLKQKIGYVMGDPFYEPGGKSIPYFATCRIRLTSSTKLKDQSGTIYGVKTNARVIKTRLGPAHRSVKFEIHFDKGIADEMSWLEVLQEAGMVENKAGWRYPHGAPNGIEKFREKEWPELVKEDGYGPHGPLRAWALDCLEKLMVVTYGDPATREGVEVPAGELDGDDGGLGDVA